ncbi:hypothetical protein OJAV_G00080690 [Oryzias javanicus]|uniref:ubiquitinyl hydrolase 1 n=1 Tax=Oryzias javanicus TaxID=123683 RepID=A0A437D3Q5_ORYJA|nr:hypothetical protein OJAV_G00080690 [Oryzias javanicus]
MEIMSCKAATKDKKSGFGKKLFRRGSVRSVGSFMSKVLRTLTALSHFGSEVQSEDDKDDGGFSAFKAGNKDVRVEDGDLGGLLFGERVPGVSGLKNHGNTCFMNAILQCLSNTELFAEYLVLEHYRGEELDENKPKTNGVHLQRKGPLGKGEVTEQLSGLVRALWTFEYTPQHSRDFKNAVSKNATQFKGNSQHDAQEFLLWLLDRVHEDLNSGNPISRPAMKPPIEEDDQSMEGPSPPLSAGSFVQELFQAQYRSSLTCPHCQKQSNTFDPFLCISLPIPLPHTRPLYVTVVYQGKYSHCMRIGVAVPLKSTVYRLRDAVSRETKIPMDQFVLTEMYYDGFHRSFCDDDDDLDIIQESDSIFAFETPETFRLENIRTKRGSLLANLNHNNLKYGGEISRTPSFMQGAMTPGMHWPPSQEVRPSLCTLYGAHCDMGRPAEGDPGENASSFETWSLYSGWTFQSPGGRCCRHHLPSSPGRATSVSSNRGESLQVLWTRRPPHVKIVVEWDKETKDYLFGHTEEEYVPDAESVYLHREQHHQPQACTLAQCFQLYTKEEQLAPDDAWRCPHCKQLQQGRIKLSLWTLPDVLILHLKRFRQEGDRRVKMQNMVRFPLMEMDMAPHVVKRSQSSWSLPSHWSPWRRSYGLGRNPDDYLYDLYAVCNHHGNMHGGHYTAYCKNSIDGQWYCFDDSEVSPIADEEVCQQSAYILFYQRRSAIPSWSANSSVAGSTSSSLCDHWINRLPGSRPASLASGASSRRTSLASLAESGEFPGERIEDDGGFSVRPFVRSIQRQSLSSRSSVASPLAFSDGGMKPSWSLSAKLQMRSNSPSRFSLDSRCSPPLERIGEACDDKVSTSCFGSYSRHERYFGSRTPLSTMESSFSGQDKRFLDMMYCRAPTPVDKKTEATENNNEITAVDQNILPAQAPPPKEQKRKSSIGGFTLKAESSTKVSNKAEQEKTSRKRLCATSKSSTSETSSSTPVKGKKVSSTKEKGANAKKNTSTPSGTPSKTKDPTQPAESAPPSKPCVRSTPQSSASPSPTAKKNPSVADKTSASGRKRLVERSFSRDSMHTSPLVDGGRCSTRSSLSRSGDVGRTERRSVRSSSSSSSVTSLRSPSVSTRDLQRSSKSEEKGLSFFKSALRQRESRRSADLGKSSLLTKKSSDKTLKQNGQAKEGEGATRDADAQEGDAKKETPFKPPSSLSRTLLNVGKSKSSLCDVSKSPSSGKKPLERMASSRKLSSGMQSPARTTQRPQ